MPIIPGQSFLSHGGKILLWIMIGSSKPLTEFRNLPESLNDSSTIFKDTAQGDRFARTCLFCFCSRFGWFFGTNSGITEVCSEKRANSGTNSETAGFSFSDKVEKHGSSPDGCQNLNSAPILTAKLGVLRRLRTFCLNVGSSTTRPVVGSMTGFTGLPVVSSTTM